MSWPENPSPLLEQTDPLFAFCGTREANDPRSGIMDTVTIYRGSGIFAGHWAIQRRMQGVYPGLQFVDPRIVGFKMLFAARAWIRQEFPYVTSCVQRAPHDDPSILETWL